MKTLLGIALAVAAFGAVQLLTYNPAAHAGRVAAYLGVFEHETAAQAEAMATLAEDAGQ